jgi:hypothetical protein
MDIKKCIRYYEKRQAREKEKPPAEAKRTGGWIDVFWMPTYVRMTKKSAAPADLLRGRVTG